MRCSTATRRSRTPESPPPCSTIRPAASCGWRTSSPNTAMCCRPGRPCWPGRSPAPCGSIPVTPSMPTTESWEPSHVVSSRPSADLRRACVGPGRGPAPGRDVGVLELARGCRDRRGLGDAVGAHRCRALSDRPRDDDLAAAGDEWLPATPVVRVPVNDRVVIKQFLDLGAQNLLVPMVDTEADAEAAVAAVRYPPRGVRGVGSALARASRWNAVDGYLSRAEELLSLTLQIESATAVDNAAAIAAVDGIDQVFVGPSDLAASMGLLGQQTHPEVTDAVARTFEAVRAAGKPV